MRNLFLTLGVFLLFSVGLLAAEPEIRLEIFSESRLNPQDAQTWGAALSQAGMKSVQVRGPRGDDALDIISIQPGIYRITAMLAANGQVMMPGGEHFRIEQVRRIKPYLLECITEWEKIQAQQKAQEAQANRKPTPVKRVTPETGDSTDRKTGETAYPSGTSDPEESHTSDSGDLSADEELALAVNISTVGLQRAEAIRQVVKSFHLKFNMPRELYETLSADKKDLVEEELQGLASGTALAYLLRYAGMCYSIETSEGTEYYLVSSAKEAPAITRTVGFPLGVPVQDALPGIRTSFNANVTGASVAQVVAAVAKRLQVKVLYDHNSLARFGKDPQKMIVKHPAKKTTYDSLLDVILYQGGLQKEVRMDEQGIPFIWISTLQKAQ